MTLTRIARYRGPSSRPKPALITTFLPARHERRLMEAQVNSRRTFATAQIALALALNGCGDSRPVDPQAPAGNGAVIEAALFDTDSSRTADGADPGDAVNPILSAAPPFGDATPPLDPPAADGKTLIRATVFVPRHRPGETFPVILHGNPWGGTRSTAQTPESDIGEAMFDIMNRQPANMRDEGYVVVSFDNRGWGDSEGELRSMDPAYETQDAIAVLDWIAAEGRAGRLPVAVDANGDFRVGTVGGSYGGGFQLLLAAEDPRIDAMIPAGTWHDLRYSIGPGGVIKASFGNLLCALGYLRRNRDDNFNNACATAALPTTRMREDTENPPPGLQGYFDFVHTHGLAYYAENDSNSPVTTAPSEYARRGVPTLLVQGSRDNLFNFNEAYANARYLSALPGAPDVRLFSNQSGHMNPLAGQTDSTSNCGALRLQDAIRIWFAAWLKDDHSGLDRIPRRCMSLDAVLGIELDDIPLGDSPAAALFTAVSAQVDAGSAPPPGNGLFVKLADIATPQAFAGIAQLRKVTVSCVTDPLCAPYTRQNEPVAFVGIGLRRAGVTTLLDDQVFPIRAAGSPHARVDLPGVAEKLEPGDELGLMLYTIHPQFRFPAAAPTPNDAYRISADVTLPIFTPDPARITALP